MTDRFHEMFSLGVARNSAVSVWVDKDTADAGQKISVDISGDRHDDVSAWMSPDQARRLAAGLTLAADAAEAQEKSTAPRSIADIPASELRVGMRVRSRLTGNFGRLSAIRLSTGRDPEIDGPDVQFEWGLDKHGRDWFPQNRNTEVEESAEDE